MLLKFFGAAQEVGRSAILLKDDKSIMLDYGVKVDEHKVEYPIGLPRIDAAILSHAHLDHCGAMPTIYNEMLIPTFGTAPTLELSQLLLEDAIKIAKKERHTPPKFHKRQLYSFVNRFVSLGYGESARVGNISIELRDAGHICGSAVVALERSSAKYNKRIVYTGDFRLSEQYLHKGAETMDCDVLITESTYALREHPDRKALITRFINEVKEVLDNGGNALVPVFAVGRSQEILAILHEHGLASYAYLDGMARAASKIARRHSGFIRRAGVLSKALSEATLVENRADRMEALNRPSIILTTAGMLSGGPVLNYITKLRKGSRILLTGYQTEGTNGRSLLENGTIVIDGEQVKINAPVAYYDFSAHAGKKDLYDYVRRCSPSTVVCVHGDKESAESLSEGLKLEGYEAFAPSLGETIKLD